MSLLPRIKRALQTRRNAANPLIRFGVSSIYAARDLAAATKQFFADPKYRSLVLLKVLNPGVHQTTVVTWMNRYPAIFTSCRAYFGSQSDVRILSYGCSTGEEVLTLREYFPSAFITGAEINPRSLAICRKLQVDGRIAFVHSDRKTIRDHGSYDAIFCMAVLQRTPHLIEQMGVESLKKIYPFEKFDRQISELDAVLNVNGLLVIHHAHYLLADAEVAARYQPLEGVDQEVSRGPKFGKDSARLPEVVTTGSIFIKRRG